MNLLYETLREIADREGIDPLDLETPLYEVIDADILESLTDDAEHRQDGSFPPIDFVYYGYTVKIDSEGNIDISEQTSTTDGFSRESPECSLETISNEIDLPERAMKNIADVIAARNRPFVERLDGILRTARKTLGTESATLSYVDDDTYVFEAVDVADTVEIHAGETVPLSNTACKRVTETEQALVLRDVETEAPELTDSAFEVSSYLGVPVFVDDEVYGTFCFYDTNSRDEEFSEWHIAFVELLSNWVSSELEKRKRERALHAATTDRPSGVN